YSPPPHTRTLAPHTLSLHDALPISVTRTPLPSKKANRSSRRSSCARASRLPNSLAANEVISAPNPSACAAACVVGMPARAHAALDRKSNTSELQSLAYLVCRLLLEK